MGRTDPDRHSYFWQYNLPLETGKIYTLSARMRSDALSVPIIALTVREQERDSTEEDAQGSDEPEDAEGVFVVRDGEVTFTPVETGITGQEFFEVLSGVQVGDTIVAGPYQRIRQLRNGDAVKRESGGGPGDEG